MNIIVDRYVQSGITVVIVILDLLNTLLIDCLSEIRLFWNQLTSLFLAFPVLCLYGQSYCTVVQY